MAERLAFGALGGVEVNETSNDVRMASGAEVNETSGAAPAAPVSFVIVEAVPVINAAGSFVFVT